MLNTEHFTLFAGCPEEWDNELRLMLDSGKSLVEIQEDQHERGRRSAELIHSSRGWIVRYASGLDNWSIIFDSGDQDVSRAMQAGCSWANEDPANREFFASNRVNSQGILDSAKSLVEEKRKEGWGREDFAKALKDMLDS